MQSLRSVNAPAARWRVAGRGRTSLRVIAAVDWAFEADSTTSSAAAAAPPIVLDKLWERQPHRCIIAAKGMNVVKVGMPPAINQANDGFNGHTQGISLLVPARPDYFHNSTAHCVFVIESPSKDSDEVTICLQRGDRSAAQAKLNGKLLKAEKKTPVRPGDVLQLPGVEYRVKRNSLAHA